VGIIPITKELLVSPSSRSEFRAKKPKKKKKKKKRKEKKRKEKQRVERNKNMAVDMMLPCVDHSELCREN
jgi:hypothetical protein